MTLADPLQASLLRLSAKGISVFSPHTSLDATPNGINTFLIQPFVQYAKDGTSEVITPPGEKVAGFEGAGMGRRVDLGKGLEVSEVVRIVKEHLSLEHGMPDKFSRRAIELTNPVQIATPQDQLPIESIAVCAGSGSFVHRII
jgi:putative NIF3 family GTP cyclohydrolase 1 type 2